MRGQKMNEAQRRATERLWRKGWRGTEDDMFGLAVPLDRDRPYRYGRWADSPDPCMIHVRRDGTVHRGYPRSRTPSAHPAPSRLIASP